jgi:hypothetical protein
MGKIRPLYITAGLILICWSISLASAGWTVYEDAASVSCGGDWNVTNPCSNVYDSNYVTYGELEEAPASDAFFYANYTKLSTITSAEWAVKEDGDPVENITIESSCVTESPIQLRVLLNFIILIPVKRYECWDGDSWEQMGSVHGGDRLHEEGVWLYDACDYYLDTCKTSGWEANKVYCLNDSITPPASERCMDFDVDNVTLDGNGYSITAPDSMDVVINISTDNNNLLGLSLSGLPTNPAIGIVGSATNNTLSNNDIVFLFPSIVDISSGTNYLVYNNSYGRIEWTDAAFLQDLDVGNSITFGTDIILGSNLAYLNTSHFSIDNSIDSSANITLYGTPGAGLSNPVILRNGVKCNDTTTPRCHNFTSLSASTVIFNVSGWSNYSLGEADLSPPVITLTRLCANTSATFWCNSIYGNATVTTDEAATCRISIDGDETYAQMSDDGSCYSADGLTHTCTIFYGMMSSGATTPVVVACNDTLGNYNDASNNKNYTVYLDVNPPLITWVSQLNETSNTGHFNVTIATAFVGSHNLGVAAKWCNIDINGTNASAARNGTTDDFYYEWTALADGNYTIKWWCNDTLNNSEDSSWCGGMVGGCPAGVYATKWYKYDSTAPVITWNWADINTTQSSDPQDVNWTTDEAANCTLWYNASSYAIAGAGTSHTQEISGYADGNYTFNVTCDDAVGNSRRSTNAWLNVSDWVKFVPPTRADADTITGGNGYFANITANFDLYTCYLTWNKTGDARQNYTMAVNGNNSYLNKSVAVEANYTYTVHCNSTYSSVWQHTEQRVIEMLNPIPADTTPPVFTAFYPANNTAYSASLGGSSVTMTFYTSEQIDTCGWSLLDVPLASMTNFTSINGLNPAYRNTFTATLPFVGYAKCWYARCNDTAGNDMVAAKRVCLAVSSGASGGGGGPGGTIVLQPDNFVFYKAGDTACKGAVCKNSVTYNAQLGADEPIPYSACAGQPRAPSEGVYTICNIADHSSTLNITVVGYSTTWGNTSEFLTINESSITLNASECANFKVEPAYPNGANEVFSNTIQHPYIIRVSGVEITKDIRVEKLEPTCGVSSIGSEGLFGDIFGFPVWLWGLVIFIIILLILVAVGSKKQKSSYRGF